MATKLRTACTYPGCPDLAVNAGRCSAHKPKPWARPNGVKRAGGRAWQRMRGRIFERDGYACAFCGAPAEQVHHIIARAFGGSDSDDNLCAICKPCNLKAMQLEARGKRPAPPPMRPERSEEITF